MDLSNPSCCSGTSPFSECNLRVNCNNPWDINTRGYANNALTDSRALRSTTDASNLFLFRQKEPNIDLIMAEELNALSMKERDRLTEEIHGVCGNVLHEEEGFVESRLVQLEDEIAKISGKSRVAYDLAMKDNPHFVQRRKFRLQFLRFQDFEADKAARSILKHFRWKRDLFGEDKLGKNITFDDLGTDDQAALLSGSYQFLDDKDVKGRAIVYLFSDLNNFVTVENQMRAFWYQCMAAMEDEYNQRHGFIHLCFGNADMKHHQFVLKMGMLDNAIPSRTVSIHVCLLEQTVSTLMKMTLLALNKSSRLRVRIHMEDTAIRHLYVLQSFGINPSLVPLGTDGQPKLDRFLKVVEERRQKERQLNEARGNIVHFVDHRDIRTVLDGIRPTDRDVLLGRGREFKCHTGNKVLERLIEEDLPRYNQEPSSFGKTCIVVGVVQRIKDIGGRFIRQDKVKKEWSILDDAEVHAMVGTRFRKHKKGNR